MCKYSSKNGNNLNKILIRKHILSFCTHLKCRLGIRCLTLPNLYFDFEDDLLSQFKVKEILCYERNRNVYRKISVQHEKVTFKNQDVLKDTGLELDICWLDLMNDVSPTLIERLRIFFGNNTFRSGGILSITVAKPFRSNRGRFPSDYLENGGFDKEIIGFLPKDSIKVDSVMYYNSKSWMYNLILKIT